MPKPVDPVDPASTPMQEYRLRIHPQRPEQAWRAELRELAALPDAAPLTFDTPLELARYLARDATARAPGAGLR